MSPVIFFSGELNSTSLTTVQGAGGGVYIPITNIALSDPQQISRLNPRRDFVRVQKSRWNWFKRIPSVWLTNLAITNSVNNYNIIVLVNPIPSGLLNSLKIRPRPPPANYFNWPPFPWHSAYTHIFDNILHLWSTLTFLHPYVHCSVQGASNIGV